MTRRVKYELRMLRTAKRRKQRIGLVVAKLRG
jgi:hypothetical protein